MVSLYRKIAIGLLLILATLGNSFASSQDILTLQDCIRIAQENHPTLIARRESLSATKTRVIQARAQSKPRIDFETSYTYTEPLDTFSIPTSKGEQTVEIGSENNYEIKFELSKSIYDGGATSASVNQTISRVQVAKEKYRSALIEIIYNVKKTYYDVLERKSILELSEELLKLAKEDLKLIQVRYKIGLIPEVDVITAELEVSVAELDLIAAKNNLDLAMASLNNAMGLDQNKRFEITELAFKPKIIPELRECIKEAFINRPELIEIKAEKSFALDGVRLAKSRRLPTLNIFGNYNWKGDQFFPEEDSWTAGVRLNLNICDGSLTKAQISEAKAKLSEAEANKLQIEQNVRLELKREYLNLKEAKARIEVTEKSVTKAKESLRLAKVRYNSGIALFIELTNAKVNYTRAKTDLIQSIYKYNLAWASLKKAMGNGVNQGVNQNENI